ncbi:MAG: glycosyltransferase, partial [Candidatus Eremiobacteraeota bacterium]|nr:glycosyltransferase [Candidatus Eremiobacteraeota bacterium]
SLFWILVWGERFGSMRYLMRLEHFLEQTPPEYPRVSVLVAACNEAATIEKALESLLELDYPDYEVVVVNDRSSDETGAILDSLARPGLVVVHNHQLPSGWLGKNHALHLAARRARGDVLLFTDADVHFEPSALKTAVAAMANLRVDHLVMVPTIETEGFWEKSLIGFFTFLFGTRFRPELVHRDPRYFVGVGAFNMVRRRVYEEVGGHEAISLQVADDLMLGKMVKQGGFSQVFLAGQRFARVRWVVGLGGLVRGLEKNAFAGMEFSVSQTLIGCLGLLVVTWAPLLCGRAGLLPLGLMLAGAVLHNRRIELPGWSGLTFPLASLVLNYTILRSMLLTLWRGGIWWRGTFYSLRELRSQPISFWT